MTGGGTVEKVALNADVVGFSRLLADDADGTRQAVEAHRRLVEEKVAASGGTLVNFVGDNFMALFDTAEDAMQAAIGITVEVEQRNAGLPERRWVRFRMGLDEGEVSREGDRWFGDALNIAARLQAKAPAGGISVSGRVFRALDEPALRFRPAQRSSLKNIPEPVDVFEFADLPSDRAPSAPRLSLRPPTLVVLPIHTERVDDTVRGIADVIRSDVLHRLSTISRLRVVDGRSGAPVAADYLLESGVHQFGDQVRAYAKVLQFSTMNLVTSHKWTSTVDGLLALSDTICNDVERGVAIELVIGEQARLFASVADPEVARRIYEGWFQLTSETHEGWRESVRLFEEIAAEDIYDVYGYALAAFANWFGVASGFADDPEATLDRAYDEASRVLAAGDDPSGLANMVLGAVLLVRGDTDAAVEVIEEAKITRPTCEVTYALEGSVRRYLGHWQKAVDLMGTAMKLSALPPTWYPTVMACSLFMGRRLDRAAETADAVIEQDPDNFEALLILAAVQVEMGVERRARATAAAIRDRFPAADVDGWLRTHPFKDEEFIARWRADLATLGLVAEPEAVSPPG